MIDVIPSPNIPTIPDIKAFCRTFFYKCDYTEADMYFFGFFKYLVNHTSIGTSGRIHCTSKIDGCYHANEVIHDMDQYLDVYREDIGRLYRRFIGSPLTTDDSEKGLTPDEFKTMCTELRRYLGKKPMYHVPAFVRTLWFLNCMSVAYIDESNRRNPTKQSKEDVMSYLAHVKSKNLYNHYIRRSITSCDVLSAEEKHQIDDYINQCVKGFYYQA